MNAGDKENFFSREKKFSLSPAPPFSFKKSGLLWNDVESDISFFKKSGLLCDDISEPQRSDSSRRSETKTEGRVFSQPAERAGKKVSLSPALPFSFKKSGILFDDKSPPAAREDFRVNKCNDKRTLFRCDPIKVKCGFMANLSFLKFYNRCLNCGKYC